MSDNQNSLPVPRKTIKQICKIRDDVIAGYSEAWDLLNGANSKIKEVRLAASHLTASRTRFAVSAHEISKGFLGGLELPKKEVFMEEARRLTDRQAWAHLVENSQLEKLMDQQLMKELAEQLLENPQAATEETVVATLQVLVRDSGMILRRGVANSFSGLDRRFKSHDGWKMGSRIILTGVLGEYGGWNFRSYGKESIRDVERAFFILDGKMSPLDYGGIVGAIEKAKEWTGCTDTEYFRAKWFENRNVHLWFKRKDLLAKVNKLLGEYYGDVIPDGTEEAGGEEVLKDYKVTLAKNHGYFPTPPELVGTVLDHLPYKLRNDTESIQVLEPSAGDGAFSAVLQSMGYQVDCVEVHQGRATKLKESGLYRSVMERDFLLVPPTPKYQLIVMNPPFDRERDIDHVAHALGFLAPGGCLMSIMSAGTEFRNHGKSVAFRKKVARFGGKFTDLPAGSFAKAGTNVNTVLLTINN